jgi:hypothetical protein
MDNQTPSLDLLMSLEARHDELLLQLDELDKRVERTLAECQVYRVGSPGTSQNAAAA